MGYGLSRLYGLWSTFPCEPTRWTQKCMEFKGVWGMWAMGYEGVDCIQIYDSLSGSRTQLSRAFGVKKFMTGACTSRYTNRDQSMCALPGIRQVTPSSMEKFKAAQYYALPLPRSLGTPAITKCHIFWRMSVTDCDFSQNRTSPIHRFFWRRKAEIGWIRSRRPCIKFCGKRFCGRAWTQKWPTERGCGGSGRA